MKLNRTHHPITPFAALLAVSLLLISPLAKGEEPPGFNAAFSSDHRSINVTAPGFTRFTGTSSVVYSIDNQRKRISQANAKRVGPVRRRITHTPFGKAEVSEATFQIGADPFLFTLR